MSYIDFKRERDIGSIIGDTFAFIRENWKAYFLTVIKIAGPFILLGAILLVWYMNSISDLLDRMVLEENPGLAIDSIGRIYGNLGVYSLVSGLVYLLISLSSVFFIKSYIDHNGEVNFQEIRSNAYAYIWRFLGLGILIGIIIMVGFILCILPGIYFVVVFSLASSIMIFENKSIGDSISHCFYLIKDEWWNTFGCIIVVGILVTVIGWVFQIPVFIYSMINEIAGSTQDDPTQVFGVLKDPVYIGLNVLSNVGAFVLSSISLIASVFIYFDLNEQKNMTGTLEKIDSLGQ